MGLTLIGSFLSVLFNVTSIVGGSLLLGTVVVGALALGLLMASIARPRLGEGAIVGIFCLGLVGYLLAIPDLVEAVVSLELLADTIALLLGDMSLLQLFRADLWVVLMAPAPVYGTWYLLFRRRFAQSVWIGGTALLFVVLTGDASETVALVGATSGLGVLGFGRLDHEGWSWEQVRTVSMVLIGGILLTRLSKPLFDQFFTQSTAVGTGTDAEGTGGQTLEGSLSSTSDRLDIRGSVSLSTAVRFTVTADEPSRWHLGTYDRYTGRSWIRTGITSQYREPLPAPFGRTRTLEQRFRAESALKAMPAAWKPVRVDEEVADRTRVTDLGGLQTTRAFEPGDTYTVTSERPVWTRAQLRTVGDAVSDAIERRYLQLPTDTPGRVGRFAAELTSRASTRFDKASIVERWLTARKGYSLEVSRPSGDIADAFIFEMNRGYCVYFATAMTVMLRSVGVPARFVVGYTTGAAVDDDRWQVRGLNSHAWVQVYFNQYGWVSFDPTPGEQRRAVRARRLGADGSSSDELLPGGDNGRTGATPTPEGATAGTPETPPPAPNGSPNAAAQSTPTLFDAAQPDVGPTGTLADGPRGRTRRSLFTGLSDIDRLAVFAGAVGMVLGVNRLGLLLGLHRQIRIRWQSPTDAPLADIERALERLEWVLARTYRPRQPNETRRAYLDSLQEVGVDDGRLNRIMERYEEARYRGEYSAERAAEVIDLVDAYVRDHHSPLSSMLPTGWLSN